MVGQRNKATLTGDLSFAVKPIELKTYQKGLNLSTTGATGLLYGSTVPTVPIDPETSLDIGVIGLAAVLAKSNVALSFDQPVSLSDRRKRPVRENKREQT